MDLVDEIDGMDELEQAMLEELMLLFGLMAGGTNLLMNVGNSINNIN